ncbi:MAG TPA: N-acetylglucosamine-6-phosphate deacetylase [Woeseiaceae bacterium]|nr:N-acetylglucosamine-6-phosphate deacetylase [Woeseiaceae bacterium]
MSTSSAGTKQRLSNGRVFDGEQLHMDRDVVVEGGRITALIARPDTAYADHETIDLQGHLLAPGLIDLQVNGGGGVLFNAAPRIDSLQAIGAAHRQFGTTAFLATVITDHDTVMQQAIAAVERAIAERVPGVIGIHLEGPHLNSGFRGVHDEARMRELDEPSLARICSLQGGRTLLTLAPETVDTDMISRLVASDIVVCAGHSSADYAATRQALDAGLNGFTHLFNAMTGMQSREPGMVGAALEDETSFFGIIADGYHVHPAMFAVAVAAKATGKAVLVSDAMPSVGSTSKNFDLFGVPVRAEDGRCVTPEGRLAGSDIGLISAVRNACRFARIDQYEALRMASTYAAQAIRLDNELGYIRPGYRANLIELDDTLDVRRSWIDGERLNHVAGTAGAEM